MPLLLHEEIIELLRRDPLFALEDLRRRGVLVLPPFTVVEVVPSEVRELLATERRADVVIVLRAGDVVFVVVIEVQTSPDEKKKLSWPLYLTNLRAQYGCPTVLVIFAPDEKIRTWAAQPIEIGHPGFHLAPLVVGPNEIARITDADEARAAPYRAVLSALVHAGEPGAEHLALAAFDAIATIEASDPTDWRTLVFDALSHNEVARKALSLMFDVQTIKRRTLWFREGRDEGRLEGLRSSVATFLTARGLSLAPEQRAMVEACSDVPTLERWITQAASATSVEDALR